MCQLLRKCLRFLHDERGSAGLEYALITPLVWGTSFACGWFIKRAECNAQEQIHLALSEYTLDN